MPKNDTSGPRYRVFKEKDIEQLSDEDKETLAEIGEKLARIRRKTRRRPLFACVIERDWEVYPAARELIAKQVEIDAEKDRARAGAGRWKQEKPYIVTAAETSAWLENTELTVARRSLTVGAHVVVCFRRRTWPQGEYDTERVEMRINEVLSEGNAQFLGVALSDKPRIGLEKWSTHIFWAGDVVSVSSSGGGA